MANSVSDHPSQQELREAFQAGFESIDDGDGFYFGFHTYLESHGFNRLEETSCTCMDDGDHGHQPECRWVKS